MTPEHKARYTMAHEGQAMVLVGEQGAEHAVAMGHCVVDGVMNAMIRLEGPEKAAEFAFALSDRVVGQIKTPTGPRIVPPKPLHKMVRRDLVTLALFSGFVAGVFAGAYIAGH
jgi:hypothetical protein